MNESDFKKAFFPFGRQVIRGSTQKIVFQCETPEQSDRMAKGFNRVVKRVMGTKDGHSKTS